MNWVKLALAGPVARRPSLGKVGETAEAGHGGQRVADSGNSLGDRGGAGVGEAEVQFVVAVDTAQRRYGRRVGVQHDYAVGGDGLAAVEVAGLAAHRQLSYHPVGADDPDCLADVHTEKPVLGVLDVGEHLAVERGGAGDDVHYVGALLAEVGDTTDLGQRPARADIHPPAEHRTRLDGLDVRERRQRRQLSTIEDEGAGIDRQVGQAVRGDGGVHRPVHQRGHGEQTDTRDRQRQRRNREEGARLAPAQVGDRFARQRRDHLRLLTRRTRRRRGSRRSAGRARPARDRGSHTGPSCPRRSDA